MKMSSITPNIFKKKVSFLALFCMVVIGFTFSASPAAAWSLFGFALESINGSVSWLLYYLVLTPLAWLLAWAGKLVNIALQPWPLISSDFVQTGWVVMRDLSNMLFILALLGIALNYILFSSFGVKKTLPRLLFIALLINFSLPLAGVVLDFANIVTSFFIAQSGGAQFTEAMGNRLGFSTLFNANNAATATTAIAAADGVLFDIIFAIIFVTGTLFVFLALAAMFFIRHFYLSVLLIVLPLVLTASILPFLSSHFKKWTDKFFKWTMFAPACSFFLYLAMVFLDSTQMTSLTNTIGSTGGSAGFFVKTATQITTYIFAWGLMVLSLTTAQSMGIAGAGMAVSTFNKGAKWARGKAYGAAKTGAAATGRRMKADERLENLAKGLRTVPGLGGMLESGVRTISSKTKMAMEKQEGLTQQQKTQYEKSTDNQLRREYAIAAESKLPGSGAKAAQIAEILARRGNLNVLDESGAVDKDKTKAMVKEAYGFAKQHKYKGISESIMKANPVVYQEIVEKEWQGLADKDSLSEVMFDRETGKLIRGRKKDTGETFEDAKNKAFEKMGSTDFEGLKGSWDEKAVRSFLFSGAMGSNHVRMASNANDHAFINHLSSALGKISDDEIKLLQQKSPSMVSFLAGGRAKDFVKVPDSFSEKSKDDGRLAKKTN